MKDGYVVTLDKERYVNTVLHVHDNHMGRVISNSKEFYDLDILSYITSHIPFNGMWVVAGANIGNEVVFFSKHGLRVLAFESLSINFRLLEANVKDNRLQDLVQCQWYGLWNKQRLMDVDVVDERTNKTKLVEGNTVQVVCLDQYEKYFQECPLRCIRIDVGGNEYELLLGSVSLIAQYKPDIVATITTDEQFDKVVPWLLGMGYELKYAFGDRRVYHFSAR